ncbi:8-oxo-dGTP pyrophosphatase MutT (NUDIX family) [Pseudomonas citronellolis]|uniref:hypothetical protein n=1 Tax=Pseudomonas citronellolis TaxID=53408 RepID=UPI0020A0489C|nr:hypothetical protein [Pseudomonas citronellolis]MCP1641181.1 8-oxo-dGTP pyrophosphatase MutT (NUDIX family) [Pseudomonas citronellolis]MCP1664099.1 8-oxo-dGTP pyrophosphatase MutT (NUDIX family) [Pseudomonas citronellolis]MCP1695073.1 8-oxo-dGTP pyrophosphatase MutT (NUDIX family) [Pseudomonas citronellolis]MCP1701934.1 8-oxo-dGTP pyrophosphatase MutT (NUDIX family) [Pseudomonas citronellolis]MCP1795820.1 8-oxo-dGTP pyrophosphatase MutT (NUDIX family) [Pseudomonas citronellolis]
MPSIEPRPATSILLLREAEEGTGLEVFMLLRNPQVAFCGGALVFPGGKVEQADGHARLRQHCLGADALDDDELRFRVAGLRELFEESGILLARRKGNEQLLDGAELVELKSRWQGHLQGDAGRFLDLLQEEALHLAIDLLEPFAHWITPAFLDKASIRVSSLLLHRWDRLLSTTEARRWTRCGSIRCGRWRRGKQGVTVWSLSPLKIFVCCWASTILPRHWTWPASARDGVCSLGWKI